MSTVLVSIEGVSVRRHNGKPKLLVRGRRRKAASKLKRALETLESQDWQENRRSAMNRYDPLLILGAANSRHANAVALLKQRLAEVLAAKA